MRIWFAGNGLEWFRHADLDNFNDNRLNYPEGAFSRLLDFCIVPGFWINLMIFELSYTIFGSISMPLAPSLVLQLDNFFIFRAFYTIRAKLRRFALDNFNGFLHFYTIRKARQAKMSENRAVKMAILDKFRLFLIVLYQRSPKKMSENAERPARSRPRIGADGAADLIEREIPAAERGRWSGRPHFIRRFF